MSTGNSWVDAQLDNAASTLANMWKNNPRAVQPENNLKPDTAALQFRIKLLEDRVEEQAGQIQRLMRHVGNPR